MANYKHTFLLLLEKLWT